jgi:hypothetical protein
VDCGRRVSSSLPAPSQDAETHTETVARQVLDIQRVANASVVCTLSTPSTLRCTQVRRSRSAGLADAEGHQQDCSTSARGNCEVEVL